MHVMSLSHLQCGSSRQDWGAAGLKRGRLVSQKKREETKCCKAIKESGLGFSEILLWESGWAQRTLADCAAIWLGDHPTVRGKGYLSFPFPDLAEKKKNCFCEVAPNVNVLSDFTRTFACVWLFFIKLWVKCAMDEEEELHSKDSFGSERAVIKQTHGWARPDITYPVVTWAAAPDLYSRFRNSKCWTPPPPPHHHHHLPVQEQIVMSSHGYTET